MKPTLIKSNDLISLQSPKAFAELISEAGNERIPVVTSLRLRTVVAIAMETTEGSAAGLKEITNRILQIQDKTVLRVQST